MNTKLKIAFLFGLLMPLFTYGSTGEPDKPLSIPLHFRVNQSDIDPHYMDNMRTLRMIDSIFITTDITRIDSIRIFASASPEGNYEHNIVLAQRRGLTVRKYLVDKYPRFNPHCIRITNLANNWEELYQLAKDDPDLPSKHLVLQVLKAPVESKSLQELLPKHNSEQVYKYMHTHYFPLLRKATAFQIYYKPVKTDNRSAEEGFVLPEAGEAQPLLIEVPAAVIEAPIEVVETPVAMIEVPVEVAEVPVVVTPVRTEEFQYHYRRPIAVKTNLLFDLATALNVEIEVPLARRWSLAGEWIFPWWLLEDKQHCLQVLCGTLEARYWLRGNYKHQDKSLGRHNPLAGWFIGVYAGTALYDVEWDAEGYHSLNAYMAGISAGYVQPLSRNFSMEFSVGVGYAYTDYWHYFARQSVANGEWYRLRQEKKTFDWVGPTRAKVSLVWYPHFKAKKKGGKQ